MFSTSSSQNTLYGPLGFSDVPFVLPDTLGSGAPRSAQDDFRQAIHAVQQHLARIQGTARSVLAGVEHAYHPGTNPLQTAAEAASLRAMLQELAEFLRQTGVGALPLLDPTNSLAAVPTEDKLLEDTTKSIEAEYAKNQRMQESAATVVNLLTAVDASLRK